MLKRYSSIAEITRDLQKLARQYKTVAGFIDDEEAEAPKVEIVNIRRGGVPNVPINIPGKRSNIGKSLVENNAKLDTMLMQQRTLRNMIATITHDFANSGADEADKLISMATRLLKSLDTQIKAANTVIHKAASENAPPEFLANVKSLATRLKNALKDKFTKQEVVMTAGENKIHGQQFTAFIIMHEVKNDVDVIVPQQVFALSWTDNNMWINPDLIEPLPINSFSLGKEVNSIDLAMRYITAQLAANGQISRNSKMPLPFSKEKLNLKNISKDIKSIKIIEDPDNIELVINGKLDIISATEVMNDAIRYIHDRMFTENNRSRIKINHTPIVKKSNGWLTKLFFVPGGASSSRTIDQETTDILRRFMSDSEISGLKRYLAELSGAPARIDRLVKTPPTVEVPIKTNRVKPMLPEGKTVEIPKLPVEIKSELNTRMPINDANFVRATGNVALFSFNKNLDEMGLRAAVKSLGKKLVTSVQKEESEEEKPDPNARAVSRRGMSKLQVKKVEEKPITNIKFKLLRDNSKLNHNVEFTFLNADGSVHPIDGSMNQAILTLMKKNVVKTQPKKNT